MKTKFMASYDDLNRSQIRYSNGGKMYTRGNITEYKKTDDNDSKYRESRLEKLKKDVLPMRSKTHLEQTNIGFFAGGQGFLQQPEFDFGTKSPLGEHSNLSDLEVSQHKRKRNNPPFRKRKLRSRKEY